MGFPHRLEFLQLSLMTPCTQTHGISVAQCVTSAMDIKGSIAFITVILIVLSALMAFFLSQPIWAS
jgi:hypothetical protein